LLSDAIERRVLLSDGQCGSRKERSAIDPAAIMVNRACTGWKEDNITGVLLMDIKAVFPRQVRGKLIHAMEAKQIDGYLIRWTQSRLSENTVAILVEGNVLQTHSVDPGVPLGSPVTPILFPIYTTVLTKWVEERLQGDEGLSIMDNMGWMAIKKDVNLMVEKLEHCAAERMEWACRQDLQFDMAKQKQHSSRTGEAIISTSNRNSQPNQSRRKLRPI